MPYYVVPAVTDDSGGISPACDLGSWWIGYYRPDTHDYVVRTHSTFPLEGYLEIDPNDYPSSVSVQSLVVQPEPAGVVANTPSQSVDPASEPPAAEPVDS